MPAEKHSDYSEEKARLDYTLNYVEETLKNMVVRKAKIDEDVDRSIKHFHSEDSQGYIDLMVNTMLQQRTDTRLTNLEAARSRPYFARIDFKEEGKRELEKLYIGKMALIRDENQEIVIIDWRAPVANMYYESRLGTAGYTCPDGEISGDLTLKRQFSIEEGQLNEIFDIDITTNDEFLQTYLGASADNRLKDIVSTIQVEQNNVIRAPMWTPLIVQGVAGSGKTTIALHRIAYLIYTFEKTFVPENFMIIATNKLFLNYISEVLPELGVDKVKQSTFEDFACELIGKKLKIKDSNDKLTSFVNNNASEDEINYNRLVRTESEMKASMEFKSIIDDYVALVEKDFIPKEHFKVINYVLYKYEDINDLFTREYKKLPMVKRIDEIKKHLNNRVKNNKNELLNRLQLDCDKRLKFLKETMPDTPERKALIIEAIDYKNEMLEKVEKLSKTAVKDYIDKISNVDPVEHYKKFISEGKYFKKLCKDRMSEEEADFLIDFTMKNLDAGFVETEDLAPIIYMKYCIHGINEKIPVKHIVIDEAQDFSVFQFYVLKKIVKDSSFTILGDLSQGIHSYRGTKDWNDVQEHVFEGKSHVLVLKQSYRTTVEIMEAANKVIANIKDEKLVPGEPVIRHGEEVRIFKKNNMKEIVDDIEEKIKELRLSGNKSIAVICKTIDECNHVAKLFKNKKSEDTPRLITGKEKEYKGGIVILPSYLAKGLEFDAVLIANAGSEEYTETETDIKLLYVAMTRALHKLYIYHYDELSTILKDV